MGLKFSNFGKTQIASAPSGTTGLSFSVTAGTGLLFPSLSTGDYFYGIFKDASGNREIVKVTGRSTDALTIGAAGRGLDGTTARTWAAGDYFVAGLTNIALAESLSNTNLLSIGALTSAADTLPYFTGSGTSALTGLSAFIRTLLDDADAATALTTLGISTFIKTILDDADAATARTTLGAVGLTGNETVAGNKTLSGNTSFTGTIAPSQTSGIVGTTTNNDANAGSIGEVISSVVTSSSPVALTTGVSANVTSISLTAGDWDVYCDILFTYGATTNISNLQGSVSTTSATVDTSRRFAQIIPGGMVPGAAVPIGWPVPTRRISIASTTTVYLVAVGSFTVSTLSAYGEIWARRAR